MERKIRYDKDGNVKAPNHTMPRPKVTVPTATADGVAERQAQIKAENEEEKTWSPEFPAENKPAPWLDRRRHGLKFNT
jgi:hypothetical protein